MGRTRSRRPGQRLSATPAGATDAARCTRTFRPRLELLEQRVQLGDAILGLSAVAIWGLDLRSVDVPFVLDSAEHNREWHPGLFSNLDSVASLFLVDCRNHVAGSGSSSDHTVTASVGETVRRFANPTVLDDDALAGHMAAYRLTGSAGPPVPAFAANLGPASGGVSAPWQGGGEPFSPRSFVGIGDPGYRSPEMFSATGAVSPRSAQLAFDMPSGQLAIGTDAADHTVRETVAADGFVDVTLDGQRHSSNPRSASFDRALTGATGATLAGIRFEGGGQDMLILGSQRLASGLTVQAAGATVVTENVVTAGPLAIQSSNITVRGDVRASTVALAATSWVTVDAAGRIDAEPSPRRAGGVSPLMSTITVAAGVFVNSGQLHADGPTGGQITVQASNILNAGPITADGTGADGNGGQVHISFADAYIATTAAVVSASSADGPGGKVTIEGGDSGRLYSSGRHLVTGSVGGAVQLFGRDIVLAGATVDASGEAGGGSIRVGGDGQGRHPTLAGVQTVTVTAASTLRSDAVRAGDGGTVSVWSERETTFAGSVSVRGGATQGQGGLAEVSGQDDLAYAGTANAGAAAGKGGTLLLDPKNVIIADPPAGVFPQFDLIDPHPTAGSGYGAGVSVLSNGNVVVTNPNDNFGGAKAGAVYLFDGLTGALLSSLVASHPNDQVGSGGVTHLNNGNYVIQSPQWNGTRGAATWGNGSMGVSGPVSEANSLVGSQANDFVSSYRDNNGVLVSGIKELGNGNYVVASRNWNGQRGAVTWGNGNTGVSGTISDANSLVGSNSGDKVGGGYDSSNLRLPIGGIFPLSNGNYVVDSPNWNGNRGAVTWANGTTGISGTVSDATSLVGSNANDQVGGGLDSLNNSIGGIFPLSNDNYVVDSPNWNSNRGAVTWVNGSTGVSGTISDGNSLVGSNSGDKVGSGGVVPLSNGNYVVASGFWNGPGFPGAVTWGNGTTGVSGTISDVNSLVGVNFFPTVVPLSNGNYVVVRYPSGAVTWGNGSTGISGTVSAANSLVSSNNNDVGEDGVVPLTNGNYVVRSHRWNGGFGAVTWGDGSQGVRGTISAANSLVGSNVFDNVGSQGVTPLSNGNYVVQSWYGGRGAVTFGNGSTGTSGILSEANSLDLNSFNPRVIGATFSVIPLSNGNYVVISPYWNGNRGAVSWGDGSQGVRGTISDANSLVGSIPGDAVGAYLFSMLNGFRPTVTALNNGNYVVASQSWNGNRGAVTWGNGSTGTSGTVSAANSLIGGGSVTALSNGNYVVTSGYGGRGAVTWGNGNMGTSGTISDANSLVGSGYVTPLSNGNYVVASPDWNGQRGAVTWVGGTSGQTLDGLGTITPQNSLVGRVANAGLGSLLENPVKQTFLAFFVTAAGGRLTAGLTDPIQLAYATGQSQSLTITPDFLTRTLDTGTAVVLQASNDITVNSPITVSAGGNGGALTLQAGRSILLNANITTDNGALTLIANDQLANGVVDSQRDPGSAVISMATGTALDTRSGALTVELRDGVGLTNRDSGAITLQTVTAGSVSVVNNGPSPGSDVNLGPVTSSGPQSYANLNGTTLVTGNLTATDNPITFNHSVVLNVGLTLSAGSGTVNFAGGTVLSSPGLVTVAGSVVLTGSTTLSPTLNGTDSGSYSQLAAGGLIDLGGGTLTLVLGFEPPVGSTFEILTNAGSAPITGTFNGLDEGTVFTQAGYQFQITYQGGTGGDSVVLTRLA